MSTQYPTLEESVERATAEVARALRAAGDELERQVAELNTELELVQQQIAELGVRVERLAVLADEDRALGSRRIELDPDEWLGPVGEVVERLRPYFPDAERSS